MRRDRQLTQGADVAKLRKKPKRGKSRAKRRPGLLWRLLRWPVRLAFWGMVGCVLWVGLYRYVPPPGGIYMASEAWRLGGIERDWVDFDQISPHLARSAMAAEDARFCDHNGLDFDAIQQALRENERGGRVRGGSTITQQVAKNVFLWHTRSWLRKGLEAGFTVLIELIWPKQRIMEVYLNVAEFAPGIFGAEAAARHHFGRPALTLTSTQAARLAAVLPNPKERDAANPTAWVRSRAASIRDGARTLERDDRDACVL